MNKATGFINLFKQLAKGAESVSKSKATRFNPISEDEARLAVLSRIGEGAGRIRAGEGFTIDPRTGNFVDLGTQRGFMMSPITNDKAVQIPFSPNITADDIMDAIPQEYWPRLQQGGYLGSWVEDGKVYIDPAERYLTKLGSLRAGIKSGQISGADLKTPMPTNWETQPSPFYGVTKEAYDELLRKRAIQAMTGLGGAGVVGGGAAVLSQD